MSDKDQSGPGRVASYEAVLPNLAELCRIHNVGLEMIDRSHDMDELLDRVLEEYERRLEALADETLGRGAPPSYEEAQKLRALIMFATHAAALMDKAETSTALRRWADQLQRMNEELERALVEQARVRRRLDEVLETLDAGIMVVGADGRIENANRAASALTGVGAEELVGKRAVPYLGAVGRGADGEVVRNGGGEDKTVMLVARRDLPSEPQGEVVLLSDITERERRVNERHRLEKLDEVMRTLAVLSHKINNPLTSLLGRAQILLMQENAGPQVEKAATVIDESARRIADYIRELARVVREGREEALEELLAMHEQNPAHPEADE
jgi:PAS domain-containing protein